MENGLKPFSIPTHLTETPVEGLAEALVKLRLKKGVIKYARYIKRGRLIKRI